MKHPESKYPINGRLSAMSILLVLFVCAHNVSARLDAELLPTAALHQVWAELMADQQKKQPEVARQWLEKTRKAGLSRDEQYALGELYYAAFMPKEAKAAYESFAEGKDQKARSALQRLIWMKMAAFQQFDGIEKQISDYRAKFRPSKEDTQHLFMPVYGLIEHYKDTNDHARIVQTVLDEVESLPLDTPYGSFALPMMYLESFEKTGKKDVALKLIEKYRAHFTTRLEKLEKTVAMPKPGTVPEHKAGVLHQGSLIDDFPAEVQTVARIKRLLTNLKPPEQK